MNHTVTAYTILLSISIATIEGCYPENMPNMVEWLRNPCSEQQKEGYEDSSLEEALHQLRIFNHVLNNALKKYEGVRILNAVYGMCPNVTNLIVRFEQEKKVRVFYNIILKMALFLHNVIGIIPQEFVHRKRRDMYKEIFCNLKLVTCQFKIIQTRENKNRRLEAYKVCTTDDWNMSKSKMFDLRVLSSMQMFFSRSYDILTTIGSYDKSILL